MLQDTGERLILNDNWDLKTKMEHLHRYTAVSQLVKGKRVLDAACGTGYGTEILSRNADSVVGIDLNSEAVEFATSMFQKSNLAYRQMSVAELDFPDNSFDVVVSFETIEHISKENQHKFLLEISRVLKDNGILFISTPNDELERELTFGAYENPYHICEFNEVQFEEFLKQYFNNIKLYYQTVTSASVLIEKGKKESHGEIFTNGSDPDTERFYLAVCSNGDLPLTSSLDSMFKPRMQDFYDEHYYLRRASVYVDTGNGFDGTAFVHAKCTSRDGKHFSYHFDLSGIHNIQAVRFDPMEHAGIFRITSLCSNVSGISVRPVNADSSINGVDTFTTLDPIYMIMGDRVSEIQTLDIEGEILHEIPDHIAWNNKECQLREALEQVKQIREQQNLQNDQLLRLIQENQRTLNDLNIVMQHSFWCQKILRQAEHPTIAFRLAKALGKYGLIGTGKKAVKKVIQKIYKFSRRYNFLKRPLKWIKRVAQKLFPKLRNTLDQSLYEAKIQMLQASTENAGFLGDLKYWGGETPIPFAEKPLVSVIVPNYNHSAYLRDRLESVYNQTYPNFEVILLDDCSTDNSREILMEYANRYPEKTIVDFNEVNGGKVFKQWNKGFEHARGKLIWVAESDDWCDLDFLEKMVPQFEHQSVMFAFCNSIFMQDGKKTWSLGEYLADIPGIDFNKPFMMSAHAAVNTAFAIKNIVPNVSSAMFRNVGQIPSEITDIWQNIKLCGDWLFYLYTIKGGTISYTNETTNYYRIHKDSTSLRIQKSPEYYQEQEQISRYVMENYDVDPKIFNKVLHNLEQHYQVLNETEDVAVVHENYQIGRILASAGKRRPSVLMCGFSLQIGGGETYPIVLANEMKRQGITVTFLNFNMASYSEQIRGMLDPGVPVITLESPESLGKILLQTGADIVHSHHASVDTMLSVWLRSIDSKCKQVVTFHGMYETMESTNCKNSFETLSHTCKKIIYIADKNLTQLNALGYKDRFSLTKLGNGLPQMEVTPVKRSSLGIEEDAFVFCVVSRALPQKGWKEAADAVIRANRTSPRKIHLILVGDGEMREKLSSLNNPYVHLVGQRSNVRDYFAASDMGLLPSTYTGESFPLVVIECMLTGNPVLSSNLGEVKYQLTAGDGNLAGMLIELNDWKLDVDELSAMMVRLANDDALYQQLRSRVPSASEKFDISRIVRQHIEIYESVRK